MPKNKRRLYSNGSEYFLKYNYPLKYNMNNYSKYGNYNDCIKKCSNKLSFDEMLRLLRILFENGNNCYTSVCEETSKSCSDYETSSGSCSTSNSNSSNSSDSSCSNSSSSTGTSNSCSSGSSDSSGSSGSSGSSDSSDSSSSSSESKTKSKERHKEDIEMELKNFDKFERYNLN